MTHLTGEERTQYVRGMFGRIARRYDLMNRLMTFGQDLRWRREAVRRLEIPAQAVVLDAGAGTGDIAIQIRHSHPDALVIASDLTPGMLRAGKNRPGTAGIAWVAADAEHLPFNAQVFDGVISGYLLRNVSNLDRTLGEQQRVLKPQKMWAALDTTPPAHNLLQPFIRFHLQVIIPLLGRIITGESEAYHYLPDSTEGFLQADKLAARIRQAGFSAVGYVKRMLGTMAIHWGRKRAV